MAIGGSGGPLGTLLAVGVVGDLRDEALLTRFAGRGPSAEAAFAELVRRHGAMVRGACRSILGSAADAEDAAQATFLVLAGRAGELGGVASVAGWLHGVATRVARKSRAREARRRRHERIAATRRAPRPTSEPHPCWAALHEEIDRLGEPGRSVVVLCHLEGLSMERAAARLGWPVGTVKGRLHRARRRLGERLSRRGHGAASLVGASMPGSGAANVGISAAAEGLSNLILWRMNMLGHLRLFAVVGALVTALLGAGIWARGDDPRPAATVPPPSKLPAIVYDVWDLVGRGTRAEDYAPLVDLIRETVRPGSWQPDAPIRLETAPSIVPFLLNKSLIVRQDQTGHDQLVARLRQLRRLREMRMPPVPVAAVAPVEALAKPTWDAISLRREIKGLESSIALNTSMLEELRREAEKLRASEPASPRVDADPRRPQGP